LPSGVIVKKSEKLKIGIKKTIKSSEKKNVYFFITRSLPQASILEKMQKEEKTANG
jgi:hypothetical protein